MKIKWSLQGMLICLLAYGTALSQKTIHYNLANLLKENRIVTSAETDTKIFDGDRPGAISTVNTVWFKDIEFSEGIIDVDIKGKNEFLKSFPGIVFHGVDTLYDCIYFRPFNFRHEDTLRHHWMLAYVTYPDYGFARLRKEHPFVYENAINPPPDPNAWLHATIVVKGDDVKVFINHAATASLEIHLLNNRRNGKFGLFSDGLASQFANLSITTLSEAEKTIHYDLTKVVDKNIQAATSEENNTHAVQVKGLIPLKNSSFSTGNIELDLKGVDLLQQSFLGLAFHITDTSHYEVIYFRPFNFRSQDTVRRTHAVQYMLIPGYHWEKLRTEHPGVYEASVDPKPDPNNWFHARIEVDAEYARVYVNYSASPSLTVKLLAPVKKGAIGLWSDADVKDGWFADLSVRQASR